MATVQTGLPVQLGAQVTAQDRLSFTIFLALAVHAVVILGVTFTYIKQKPTTHTMEVTLAQHRSKNRPDKADFLAQFDQAGSGTLKEKALTTSPNKAEYHDTVIRETSPQQQIAAAPQQVQKQTAVVTTAGQSSQKAAVANNDKDVKPADKPVRGEKSLLQRSLETDLLETAAHKAPDQLVHNLQHGRLLSKLLAAQN
jgi:protein TonB